MGAERPIPATLDWEAFTAVLRAVSEAGIPHMIVGSVAAAFHGIGRTTNDVDVVVAVTEADVQRSVDILRPDFCVDVDGESAMRAVREKGMFNAIHYQGGFRIDFYVKGKDAFGDIQFARRECIHLATESACVETVEVLCYPSCDGTGQGILTASGRTLGRSSSPTGAFLILPM